MKSYLKLKPLAKPECDGEENLYRKTLMSGFLLKLKRKIKKIVKHSIGSNNSIFGACFDIKVSVIDYIFSFNEKPHFEDLKIVFKIRRTKFKVKLYAQLLHRQFKYKYTFENKVNFSAKVYPLKCLCLRKMFLTSNAWKVDCTLPKKIRKRLRRHHFANYCYYFSGAEFTL